MTDRTKRLIPQYCDGVTIRIDETDLLYVCFPNTLEMERFPDRLRLAVGDVGVELRLMGWYTTILRRWCKNV
jgi:hypothetical protein